MSGEASPAASACPRCGLQFTTTASDPARPDPCPSCGAPTAPEALAPGSNPVTGYLHRVWMILTRPSAFFRAMPLRGGVSGPLAFALVTHWVGAAMGFIWFSLLGGAVGSFLRRFMDMAGDVAEVDNPGRHAQLQRVSEQLQHWALGAGSVIADPFLTLVQIFFVSFLVFIGARIFVTPGKDGAPREITFESALRIVSYGMTPSILAVLPLFGGPVAYLYKVAVTVIAAREAYRIGSGRASLVALFPHVLLMTVFMAILMAMLVAVIKFFAMTF